MLFLSIFMQQKSELRKDNFSANQVAASKAEVIGHEEPE